MGLRVMLVVIAIVGLNLCLAYALSLERTSTLVDGVADAGQASRYVTNLVDSVLIAYDGSLHPPSRSGLQVSGNTFCNPRIAVCR